MEQAGHPDSASSTPVPGAVPPPPTRPAFPATTPVPGSDAASAATHPAPLADPSDQHAPATEQVAAVPLAPTEQHAPVVEEVAARALVPSPAPDETTAPVPEEPATEEPATERPAFTEPDIDQTHVTRPVRPADPAPPAVAPHDPHRASLLATVRGALLSAAEASGRPWASAHLEWSQAGTQHSGRTYLLSPENELVRLGLPDAAVSALAELRVLDAQPEAGTWLSAHLALTPDAEGEPDLRVEHSDRPYWNSPVLRMLLPEGTAAPQEPVPSDEQWLADLATFPRSAEHVPGWLQSSTAGPGAASAALRRRLAEAQYPADAVVLPGDPADATPIEGALELRQTGAHRFSVGVRDYGVFEAFHAAGTEREAADWLWNLLVAPLPVATPVAAQDLQYRSHAYQGAYAQIFAQLSGGGGALLTTLPPGVALDRLGSLDGIFLFPWATPIPNRSLPPTAGGPNTRLYQFVTTAPLHVEAEIVPPWFGQPGGSLRFRIAADGVGVRQLVTARALMEVRVAS